MSKDKADAALVQSRNCIAILLAVLASPANCGHIRLSMFPCLQVCRLALHDLTRPASLSAAWNIVKVDQKKFGLSTRTELDTYV